MRVNSRRRMCVYHNHYIYTKRNIDDSSLFFSKIVEDGADKGSKGETRKPRILCIILSHVNQEW